MLRAEVNGVETKAPSVSAALALSGWHTSARPGCMTLLAEVHET
jgi:hypothetical protein